MATTDFEYGQTFNVGDVVQAPYSDFSQKLVSRSFIEEIGEYRYVLQAGSVKENKFEPSSGGKDLALYSTKEIRENYSKFWTADKITLKKGDVFKDKYGNFYVVESVDGKAWNLNDGTWAYLKVDGNGQATWGSRTGTPVTEAKTAIGSKFSKYLG